MKAFVIAAFLTLGATFIIKGIVPEKPLKQTIVICDINAQGAIVNCRTTQVTGSK